MTGPSKDPVIPAQDPGQRFRGLLSLPVGVIAGVIYGILGRNFEVVDDPYVIGPLSSSRIRLHQISTHRLSIHFNAHDGLWTDAHRRDIQRYILRLVKARSEGVP